MKKEYKIGDKVTYYNMLTKRNKTQRIRKIEGEKIELENGQIIYPEDIVKIHNS
jgi:hypothetical protein